MNFYRFSVLLLFFVLCVVFIFTLTLAQNKSERNKFFSTIFYISIFNFLNSCGHFSFTYSPLSNAGRWFQNDNYFIVVFFFNMRSMKRKTEPAATNRLTKIIKHHSAGLNDTMTPQMSSFFEFYDFPIFYKNQKIVTNCTKL